MNFQRFREDRDDGPVIHVDGGSQDLTLCGFAYEGACDDFDDSELVEVERGKINCEDCIAVIRHAKRIPARFIAKEV